MWLFPFGLLVFRSGFLPRFIGAWLMINCFGYVALSLIALFFPTYYGTAFKMGQPILLGEVAIMLWLLIKGARVSGGGGREGGGSEGLGERRGVGLGTIWVRRSSAVDQTLFRSATLPKGSISIQEKDLSQLATRRSVRD